MTTKKTTVKKTIKKEEKTTAKVQFVFNGPDAQKVSLGGDFNNWDTQAAPMKKDKKGIWKVTVNLKSGKHEYRFLVDEKWENDPACDVCVPNDFGRMNCIRIIE